MNAGEKIHRLCERVRERCASAENARRMSYWDESEKAEAYDSWRFIPLSNTERGIPFVIELEPTCLAKINGYDLDRYYNDPECYAENYLNNMLYKFDTFQDCTPIAKRIVLCLGAAYEKSILLNSGKTNDWADSGFALKEKSDIDMLRPVDFRQSAIMERIHGFYERVCGLVDGDFEVLFPSWARGPWGIAWMLRDPEELLIDLIEDPQWVSELLGRLLDIKTDWERQKAEYFQTPAVLGNIYNDEVTSPMLSPGHYERLIWPLEARLSELHGGIKYWHSCGDTTAFQPAVDKLPNVRMVHVSPWTDYRAAAENYTKGSKALEVALYGYDRIVRDQPQEQQAKILTDIQEATAGHRVQVRAAGIDVVGPAERGIANVVQWAGLARTILLGL